MQGVYILHFTKTYKGATHYIGFSTDIYARFAEHTSGRGNPLVKAALEAGSGILLVRIWEGADRTFERKLKNRKEAHRFCPCCNATLGKNAAKHV